MQPKVADFAGITNGDWSKKQSFTPWLSVEPLMSQSGKCRPKRQGLAARFYAQSYTAKIVKIAKIAKIWGGKANLALLQAIFVRATADGDFILGEK